MRITACVHQNYFIVDGRTIHDSSLSVLKARGLLENFEDVENYRGEFLREQAYALEGAEAVAILGDNAFYRIDADGGIMAGTNFDFSEFEIPEGVKVVRKNAFRGLKCLTSVSLPGSVEVIEDDAFNSCVNLKTVTFAYGLKQIQNRAFADTGINTPIQLPSSVNSISVRSVFPWTAMYAYVDRSMPGECIAALRRCNLRIKYT